MSGRWNSRIFAAALGAALAVAPSSAAAADVVDGGFEEPAVTGMAVRTAPSVFGGWTVDAGQVTQSDATAWKPAGGAQSIRLDGASTSLSQSVPVEAGRRYRLTLRHADGPANGNGCGTVAGRTMPLQLEFGGANVATIPWSGGHLTDDWQPFRTLVTAAGPSAVLRLKNQRADSADCGMTVDDVALTAASADETALRLSAQPAAGRSVVGQPVVFTATVLAGTPTATPTGTVRFRVDGDTVGTPVALSAGSARFTLASLKPGSHSITATYEPSGTFQAAPPLSLTHVVTQSETTTTVEVDHDPPAAGSLLYATVTVRPQAPGAGTPTGRIVISDDVLGGSNEFPLDADGTVIVAWPTAPGAHHISARYLGDASFNPSTAAVTHAVRRARTATTISSSRNPVPAGEELKFTVLVATEPGTELGLYGRLQFTVDGAPLGDAIPLDGGYGIEVTVRAPTAAMTSDVGVSYSGDASTEPSSASLTQVVTGPSAAKPTPPAIVDTTPLRPATTTTRTRMSSMVAALVKGLKRRGLAGAAGITQALQAPGAGTLEQRVTTGRKRVLLASASRTVTAAGRTSLRLKLTAQGRRAARRSGKLALTIVTRFKPAGGAAISLTKRATVSTRPR